MPMGSIENLEIDLVTLEQLDTNLAVLLKNKDTIEGYLMELSKLIMAISKEQYGDIAFIHFDDDLICITRRHFKKILLNKISLYLQLESLDTYISIDEVIKSLDDLVDIDEVIGKLQSLFHTKRRILDLETIYYSSKKELEDILSNGLKTFISSLSNIDISFNFGTNIVETLNRLKKDARREIENLTAMYVAKVEIVAKHINIPDKI